MIKFFFLIPIIMCAIWTWYLGVHNYSLKQGIKGFIYILAFNSILIGFFVMMIYITHS